MYSKETYVSRRAELKKLVKSGVIILFGNNNSLMTLRRSSATTSVSTILYGMAL